MKLLRNTANPYLQIYCRVNLACNPQALSTIMHWLIIINMSLVSKEHEFQTSVLSHLDGALKLLAVFSKQKLPVKIANVDYISRALQHVEKAKSNFLHETDNLRILNVLGAATPKLTAINQVALKLERQFRIGRHTPPELKELSAALLNIESCCGEIRNAFRVSHNTYAPGYKVSYPVHSTNHHGSRGGKL